MGKEFVLAARASGKGSFRIILEHVLPNILSVPVVQATIQFALAIPAEAALSWLGLGTQKRFLRLVLGLVPCAPAVEAHYPLPYGRREDIALQVRDVP